MAHISFTRGFLVPVRAGAGAGCSDRHRGVCTHVHAHRHTYTSTHARMHAHTRTYTQQTYVHKRTQTHAIKKYFELCVSKCIKGFTIFRSKKWMLNKISEARNGCSIKLQKHERALKDCPPKRIIRHACLPGYTN